ncbi:MAG: [FeFe] hydrogenase H-cluster radical SAM maturase HydE [Candidatus Aegiribacteria sp.]|nr:[FeFe] hydrogenase H-cluster radical SAM maturase HydE [Candidatus Aegiribacteria sp.]MBD3294162.1 [FeFe] hydrogenase H-cluster radical SAM maturase HydE [Candidatus Fermentibacteria bacterium]
MTRWFFTPTAVTTCPIHSMPIPSRTDPAPPAAEELADLLDTSSGSDDLYRRARNVLLENAGDGVYLRGLVEISNHCRKNCFYCGLRRDNRLIERYAMSADEIISCLERGYSTGLRSFLLQSGESLGPEHTELVIDVLNWCSESIPDARMVLSLGELEPDTLERLRGAGGHRYLLRIETSSPVQYRGMHPSDRLHSYSSRLAVLEYLRDSGWQTGTGVLIGLPGQTEMDLAEDLLFIREFDVDMIGMGPYIENSDTPLYRRKAELRSAEERAELTARMIALARILMPTVNIAATTALQTVSPHGLRKGLSAGANVIMPNLTPTHYRDSYTLYHGKTRVADTLDEILDSLEEECSAIGRTLVKGDPGDPLHYSRRMSK